MLIQIHHKSRTAALINEVVTRRQGYKPYTRRKVNRAAQMAEARAFPTMRAHTRRTHPFVKKDANLRSKRETSTSERPPPQECGESRRNARGHGDLMAFRGLPRSARSPERGEHSGTAGRGTAPPPGPEETPPCHGRKVRGSLEAVFPAAAVPGARWQRARLRSPHPKRCPEGRRGGEGPALRCQLRGTAVRRAAPYLPHSALGLRKAPCLTER